MKKLLALLLVYSMLSSSILIARATDEFGLVDNTSTSGEIETITTDTPEKTVTEEVYGEPEDNEIIEPEEIEQPEDDEVLSPIESEAPEDLENVTELPMVGADPTSEVEEQTDLIIEDTETIVKNPVISAPEQQYLVTTPSAITLTEGSYSIGGENVDFDTSIIQTFASEFNINPNNGGFSSTPVIFRNTGSTELIIKANSCVSIGEDTPKVVRVNKFGNWLSLGRKDTAANIALGFQIKKEDGSEVCKYWFDDEGSQQSEEIYVIQPGEKISIKLIAKHGMSWVGYHTFQYRCLLEIEAIPVEIMIEGLE
jgi:hypothetical protein